MPILVKEMRLSLVWIKAFARDALMPCPDSAQYRQEFTQAQSGQGKWLLPWQPGERQHFWQYYLYTSELGDLEAVDANRAWQYLVPLRAPTWARIESPAGLRVALEGFCFPHSVGVIATLFLEPPAPLPLLDSVERAIAARLADYNVAWQDGGDPSHGSLDSLADALMDRLHQQALGQAPRGKPLTEPLTVATVIDAQGAEQADETDIAHLKQALLGLVTLRPGWRKAKTDSIGLPNPEMETHYMLERGRAIWMPKHFSEAASKIRRRSLGCYHRNQTLAALQARSLTTLVRRADEFLPAEPISIRIAKPVKTALHILDDMFTGNPATYQTGSLQHQISFYDEMINRVGQAVGEP